MSAPEPKRDRPLNRPEPKEAQRCENCVHWSRNANHMIAGVDDVMRSRCLRPRIVRETIEYRAKTDWCDKWKRKE